MSFSQMYRTGDVIRYEVAYVNSSDRPCAILGDAEISFVDAYHASYWGLVAYNGDEVPAVLLEPAQTRTATVTLTRISLTCAARQQPGTADFVLMVPAGAVDGFLELPLDGPDFGPEKVCYDRNEMVQNWSYRYEWVV